MGAAAAPGADTGVTSLPSAACPATGAAPPEPVAADGEVDLPSACAANPASDNSANVDAAKVEAEAAGNGVASADANPAAVAKRTISVGLEVSRVNMFALGNYTFGRKDTESRGQEARGAADRDIAAHREKRFLERGMRRSVAAVLLVHAHNFPHVLLLQQTSGSGNFALPGGRLRPGEGEEEGLRRKLTAKLSPVGGDADGPGWDVGDELAKWWDVDFSRRRYPYIAAHVTKPKEQLVLYSVTLPETFTFAVPKNLQLVAVPLFELYGNSSSFGSVIASVPSLLSRIHVDPR